MMVMTKRMMLVVMMYVMMEMMVWVMVSMVLVGCIFVVATGYSVSLWLVGVELMCAILCGSYHGAM